METDNKFDNKNRKTDLLKDYVEACKDPSFVKLVTKLKVKEDMAKKYTSKFQRTICELNNCKNCKCLDQCKNPSKGYVYYPRVDENLIQFDAIACKYMQQELDIKKNSSKMLYEPASIRLASMKDVDKKDKNRLPAIKWLIDFYKEYKNNKHIKGLYLHGSFGCGKSYLLAALFNELSKDGYNTLICYYPELLRSLRDSFGRSFDADMEEIKTADLLLLDDIGAESVTSWSRDEVLQTILQYRMDEELPTFFTSNLTIDELETHLSETKDNIDKVKARRIIERIKQLTDDIEIISDNRRH